MLLGWLVSYDLKWTMYAASLVAWDHPLLILRWLVADLLQLCLVSRVIYEFTC